MKISKRFSLGRSQRELDFVDIDTNADASVFLDPYLISARSDNWSISVCRTINGFFSHFIALVQQKRFEDARRLFDRLQEPNETCLGLSRGRPSGRGIGAAQANNIFESLIESKAALTGVLRHLEDTRLFVKGVDKDKVSDMMTNIVRDHLVKYTQAQCKIWGIVLEENVPSGWYWNRANRRWDNRHTEMLIVDNRTILLVPKAVVSFVSRYTPDRFRRHYALTFLQNEHLRLNTPLVRKRKSKRLKGARYVTKKSIIEQESPMDKDWLAEFAVNHPEVFAGFRKNEIADVPAVRDEDLGAPDFTSVVNRLIEELNSIHAGKEFATRYHRAVAAILELIFYPDLICPQMEEAIDQGRKRVDLTFENSSESGFFRRISDQHRIPNGFVFFEMKNYVGDVSNPELDQLTGRFHVNRGKLGFLVCRKIDDMDLFLKRCSDTYQAERGVVIPLVDNDLVSVLGKIKNGENRPQEKLLSDRFRSIALDRRS